MTVHENRRSLKVHYTFEIDQVLVKLKSMSKFQTKGKDYKNEQLGFGNDTTSTCLVLLWSTEDLNPH